MGFKISQDLLPANVWWIVYKITYIVNIESNIRFHDAKLLNCSNHASILRCIFICLLSPWKCLVDVAIGAIMGFTSNIFIFFRMSTMFLFHGRNGPWEVRVTWISKKKGRILKSFMPNEFCTSTFLFNFGLMVFVRTFNSKAQFEDIITKAIWYINTSTSSCTLVLHCAVCGRLGIKDIEDKLKASS